MKRLLVIALALVAILAIAAGCGGGGGGNGDDGGGLGANAPGEVSGVITEIDRSGGTISGFTLETDDGESHEIALDPAVDYGFDPELLEQQMQAKNRIRVTTDNRGGRRYATVILFD